MGHIVFKNFLSLCDDSHEGLFVAILTVMEVTFDLI